MERAKAGGISDRGESMLRAMAGLGSEGMRRAVLRERIVRASPEEGAALVEQLVLGALAGRPGAREGVVGLSLWLLGVEGERAPVERLRAAALAEGRAAVAAILGGGEPRLGLLARGRLAEMCVDVEAPFRFNPWRDVHVAENLARLRRLLHHHDPRMVRRVLGQRWLCAADVVEMAARRPTTPAIAREIATQARWVMRADVREALGANPFTPPAIVLPLLPALPRPLIRRLRDTGEASVAVASAAAAVLDLARV